jgi:hypothetical protein
MFSRDIVVVSSNTIAMGRSWELPVEGKQLIFALA